MKRPLAYTGGAFFLALILSNVLGFNSSLVLGLISLAFSVILGTIPFFKKMRIWTIPCFCAFLACLMFCLGLNIYVKPIENELAGKKMQVYATVLDISPSDDYSLYTVRSKVNFSDGKTRNVKYRFYHNKPLDCTAYDTLSFEAEFSKLDNDYTDSNYAKNIFINAKCISEIEVVPTKDKPFLYYPYKCREFLTLVANEKFDKETAGLIIGIMTGDKEYMTPELRDIIRISGLSHVTAVSGLHISIIASFIVLILQKLDMKKGYSYLCAILPMWFFVFVTGVPYSTVRSAFMFTLMALGLGLFRRNDSVSALFGSLMVCGIISPFSALDVGLLSSATATFGLLVLFPPLNKYLQSKLPSKIKNIKLCQYVVTSFSSTASALIGLMPCTVLFYKTFSPIAFLANFLILPLVTILLNCSLFGGVLYYVTVLSNPLLFIAGVVSKIIILLCRIFSSIPFAEISVARSYLTVTLCGILVMIGVAVLCASFGKNTKRMTALLVVLSILCFSLSVGSYALFNRDKLEVFVLDEADRICTLVVYKGEIGLICNNPDYETSREVSKLLRSLGRNSIDYMVMQEEVKRVDLERITAKVKVKQCFVKDTLEENFPKSAVNKATITYVTDDFTTPKGVRIDLYPQRSEVLVRVNKTSVLILDRCLDFAESRFETADIVISSELSLEKLKNLDFSTALCQCKEEKTLSVQNFFAVNDMDGHYTGGYGTIRLTASKEGEYSLSRVE